MPNAVLRCDTCGLPWARVTNDVLIIESRHHGQRHVNAVPLQTLWAMTMGTAQQANDAADVRPRSEP